MTMKKMMLLALICAVFSLPLTASAAKSAPAPAKKQVKEKAIPIQVKKTLDSLEASINKQVKEQKALIDQMNKLSLQAYNSGHGLPEDKFNALVISKLDRINSPKGDIRLKWDKLNKE